MSNPAPAEPPAKSQKKTAEPKLPTTWPDVARTFVLCATAVALVWIIFVAAVK